MKYILIFLFSFKALAASECWLTEEKIQAGDYYVDCREGPPPPDTKLAKRICRAIDNEDDGGLYNIEVREKDEGAIAAGLRAVGIKATKSWTPDYELLENEYIYCSIDEDKKLQKEADKLAKEAEEKAKEDAKKSAINELKTLCKSTTDNFQLAWCASKGY